jgi:hypothetical protein
MEWPRPLGSQSWSLRRCQRSFMTLPVRSTLISSGNAAAAAAMSHRAARASLPCPPLSCRHRAPSRYQPAASVSTWAFAPAAPLPQPNHARTEEKVPPLIEGTPTFSNFLYDGQIG